MHYAVRISNYLPAIYTIICVIALSHNRHLQGGVTPEMGEAHGSNWRGRAEEAPKQKACQRRNLVGGSEDGGRYSGWIPSLRSVEGAPATCGAASVAEPI